MAAPASVENPAISHESCEYARMSLGSGRLVGYRWSFRYPRVEPSGQPAAAEEQVDAERAEEMAPLTKQGDDGLE